MQVWYALDHDEWCNLPHVAHHKFCDSVYTIYTAFLSDPAFGYVKGLVKSPPENKTTGAAETRKRK